MIRSRRQRVAGMRAASFAVLYLVTALMPGSVAAADPGQPAPSETAAVTEEASPSPPATPEPSPVATAEPSPVESPAGGSPVPADAPATPEPLAEASGLPEPTPAPEASPPPTPVVPTPVASDVAPSPTPSSAPLPAIRYIVMFRQGATSAQRMAALSVAESRTVATVPALGLAVVELPAAGAASGADVLRARAGVARVELDRERAAEAVATDPQYADQWSLRTIGWPSVSAPASGSAVVAILDTGVDASHPDLVGRLVAGAAFVGGDPLTDPNGHGTWMAGIVAASTGNGEGIAGIGSAGVRVMPVSVLGADGTGWDSDIISGILFAADNGADVILLAFSAPGYSAALQSAIDYAWDRGAVIVAATGNDGVSTPTYPAGDRGVMGISSTDRDDSLAAGSNFGATTFLGAPGTDILTTGLGGTYPSITGTSASAAEVAASAAVLKAIDPDASNAVIVGRLARSAAPVGTRDETGNGRLDLGRAAIDAGTSALQPAGVDGRGGPFVGPYQVASTTTDCFRTVGSGNWNATGTWESAPTAGGCATWTAATLTPTSSANTITIRNGHTATVSGAVTVDELTVDTGGQLTVNSAVTLTLANGTGVDMTANGTVVVNGTLTTNTGSSTVVNGTLTINTGGTLTGTTTASLTVNVGGSATNTGTFNGGTTLTVDGTLTSSTSITLAATSNLQVGGTLTMTGGTLTTQRATAGSVGSINSGGSIILTGSSVWSIGTVATATVTVASGGNLDIGPSAIVSGAGLLAVASGASLKIGSTVGINTSTTTGNVQTTATDTYSTAANYEYKGSAAQITGAALPGTVNNLMINNSGPATVTLTNAATTVSTALTLSSGDLSTGAGANVLTLSAAATCNGTTDVISVAGLLLAVGTSLRVYPVAGAVPAAKANAITRTYSIAPTGGSGFAATVRLHYLDAELNGNTEALLHLWRLSGSWTDQDPSAASTTRDTTANWVQQTGIAAFSDWTLALTSAPVVTATVANLAYTENAVSTLDAGITASDLDSANLASATVTLTTNYVNGQDVLAFVSQNGITATWTPATGVLALSGSSTVANYQTALRSITYTNTSDAPSTLTRTVTFVANDGTANSTTASRQITVSAVNDAPTAVVDGYATNEDTTLTVPVSGTPYNGVLGNDTDPEANPFTAILVSGVASGTLNLASNGSFDYIPVANANGAVTFTYKANDGTADSNTVTVTITISAVNDAPSFTKGANQTVVQDAAAQSVSGWATSISRGPANESAQALDFIVSNDFNGLFAAQPAMGATGTLTYTPAASAAGIATVTVQIHDNGGVANGGVDTSAGQTFTITVSDGAYLPSSGWSTSFDADRYLKLTFPAYVPAGSVVTGATFRHEFRSATGGDTTCYYFEVYSGMTLLATHGSAGSPVSCNATTSYASDAIALPEVDTAAEGNSLSIKLFVKNSGARSSMHRIATLGVTSSLD